MSDIKAERVVNALNRISRYYFYSNVATVFVEEMSKSDDMTQETVKERGTKCI